MIHTPCASTSSTIYCNVRSSPTISNDGSSRGVRVAGFGAIRGADDGGIAERRWMWMIGEAVCEGKEIAVQHSSHVLMDGVFRRMLILGGGDCNKSRNCGGEKELSAVDAL